MVPSEFVVGPSVVVEREELVDFAHRWDPIPFHVDEEAGRTTFGGITAPGLFILALKQRLIHCPPDPHAVLASFGYDEVLFHESVRPGDILTLKVEWIERTGSRSKPVFRAVTLSLN